MGIQTPNYTATQLEDYVSELKYLSSNEQAMLLRLLKHHEEMFDGKLGTWKGTPYHIEVDWLLWRCEKYDDQRDSGSDISGLSLKPKGRVLEGFGYKSSLMNWKTRNIENGTAR